MNRILAKQKQRIRRKKSIRKDIKGTAEKPRISIYKSNRYVYVQVIDDIAGVTLVSGNNLQKENNEIKSNVKAIGALGKIIGEKMGKMNIEKAVFDRNGFRYHGVVKAVADSIRETGIKF